MKKGFLAIAVVGALMLAAGCMHTPATAATPQGVDAQKAEIASRVRMASDSLNNLVHGSDAEIPDTILAKARCVAVIPDMVKGGFVIGGRHGRGLVTCRTSHGWSAPAPITLSGGSWGAEIGVQSADVVLLFMNQGAADSLLKDQIKLGADASIAAGPVGRHAEAATDVRFDSQILSYSHTRGLFAGLDLSGSVVRQDMDTTVAMYGKPMPFRTLLSGRVPPPPDTMAFLQAVSKDFQVAKQE
jgi:lipid-binding SYLF domain-containing protein